MAEKFEDQDQEPEKDPIFEELICDISEHFRTADNIAESTLQLSTAEVYQRLQEIYPSRTYRLENVYRALKDLGYRYEDVTLEMNYKWLFRSK